MSAIPMQAQHGGSGGHASGGSSGGGHSAGGFSGGSASFSAPHISSAPSGYSSAPHYSAPSGYARPSHYAGSPGAQPGTHSTYGPRPGAVTHPPTTAHYGTSSQPTHSTVNGHIVTSRIGGPVGRTTVSAHGSTGSNHSGNNGHNGGYGNGWRRGYNGYRYNGRGFPYGGYFGPVYNPWLFYPWLDADLSWDYWHDTGDSNDAIAAASVGADAYGSAPPDGGADATSDVAQPQSEEQNEAQMQADAQAQEDAQYDSYRSGGSAVQGESTNPGMTLVFKNGQQQLIDNYVVSSSAVTITDRAGHITTIPTSALNIVATNQANAALGNGLVLTTR
jgi:hypothetical protein